MKVTLQTPTIHPIMIPTKMSLHSFNFYLVEIEDKLILIDAGIDTDKCWDIFQQVLKEQQYTLHDLDAIVLTHHHDDHIGLVNRIRALIDIPVYAHEEGIKRLKRDNTYLTARIQLFAHIFQEMGCGKEATTEVERLEKALVDNADQEINGDIIPLHGGDIIFGLDVIETPGHAIDHIMLYHGPSQVAFVGDQFIKHSSTNALIDLDASGKRTMSLLVYEASLRSLLDVPMSVAYSGHGEVMEEPHNIIKGHLERIQRKSEKVVTYLREPKTIASVAKDMYGEKYETLFTLVMSDLVGHIDRLEHMGKVNKEFNERQGIYYYQLA